MQRSLCLKGLLSQVSLPPCVCLKGFPVIYPTLWLRGFLPRPGPSLGLRRPLLCCASLALACLLPPLQEVAGELMMAACPCGPSSLFFDVCLSPSTFLWSSGCSQPAVALPGHSSAPPPSPLSPPLLLSASLSPISCPFSHSVASSGCCFPLQEKLSEKPSSYPSSSTQILLQWLDQASASSSAPQKATPPTTPHLHTSCWVDSSVLFLVWFCLTRGVGAPGCYCHSKEMLMMGSAALPAKDTRNLLAPQYL